MTELLMVMARCGAGAVEDGLHSWLTQVKVPPVELFDQLPLVPEVVSHTPLVVPFQVFVAAVPV